MAFEWFQEGAALGSAASQFALAFMYDWGVSVPKNRTKAVMWYRKSAENFFEEVASPI